MSTSLPFLILPNSHNNIPLYGYTIVSNHFPDSELQADRLLAGELLAQGRVRL